MIFKREKMKYFLVIMVICFSSCSLFSGLKMQEFNYGPGSADKLQVLVPRGWKKRQSALNSAGYKEEVYQYKNGSYIYFARTPDTTKSYQPFSMDNHIPLVHPKGGLIYKGLDVQDRYWREIQVKEFRFGYLNVPPRREIRFDSALNYAAQRIKI